MNSRLEWQFFDKTKLPKILFDGSEPGSFVSSFISDIDLGNGHIAVGFPGSDYNSRQTPAAIIVQEGFMQDALAWLKVYAPETSPLSQLVRIATLNDWEKFQKPTRNLNQSSKISKWASVTLGEILAQGDSESEISAIPLSRAYACFSTCVARASILYDGLGALDTCIERLISLEKDRHFTKRPVTAFDLIHIWHLLDSTEIHMTHDHYSIFEQVAKLEREIRSNNTAISITNHKKLLSDSIEERVIAFNSFEEAVSRNRDHDELLDAQLAAAAFLVGRSTSHLFLLRRFSKEHPAAFAWFGYFSAQAGSAYWDPDWARAVKSISRSFQAKFDWDNPTQVDLCWAEYSWIARTYGTSALLEMPKLYPRVVSIEIIPGASCQLRLAGTTSGAGTSAGQQKIDLRSKELNAALDHIVSLANKARELVAGNDPVDPPRQSAFRLEEQDLDKPTRTKRGGGKGSTSKATKS